MASVGRSRLLSLLALRFRSSRYARRALGAHAARGDAESAHTNKHTSKEHGECNDRSPHSSAFCATGRTWDYHPRRFGPTTPRKDLSPCRHVGTRCQCLLLLIAANGILSTAPPPTPAQSTESATAALTYRIVSSGFTIPSSRVQLRNCTKIRCKERSAST